MSVFFRLVAYLLLLSIFECQSAFAEGEVATVSPITRFTQWWQSLNKPNPRYQPSFATQSPFTAKIYKVGIHPLHNPKRLFEVYAPLIDSFNAAIPDATFVLEASRNYDEFDKKLYAGYFDFAMPNPYQTINAFKHGYHVFAKMGDDYNFRGIILVRKDSNIKQVADLKGKTIAYPAPTALAATLMPQYYLHTNGLDINNDVENRYVGSQESAIMNVLNGDVAAGVTWPVPWQTFIQKNPQLAEKLEIKWQTESLVNNSWVAKETMSPETIAQVRDVLLRLAQTSQGKAILTSIPISTFEAANDATYDPVKAFVTRFNQHVRPLN